MIGPWWWSSGPHARLISNDPSSNPTEVHNFSAKIVVERDENNLKEAGLGPLQNMR